MSVRITINDDDMPVNLQDMSYYISLDKDTSVENIISSVKEYGKILFSDWENFKRKPNVASEVSEVMEGLREKKQTKLDRQIEKVCKMALDKGLPFGYLVVMLKATYEYYGGFAAGKEA